MPTSGSTILLVGMYLPSKACTQPQEGTIVMIMPIYVWIAAGGRCAPLLAAITRRAERQISPHWMTPAAWRWVLRHLVRVAPDESKFLLHTRGF